MHAPLRCKSACGPEAMHMSGVNLYLAVIRTCHKIGFTFAYVLSSNEAKTTRLRPSQSQMFETKAEAKAKSPKPKPRPKL